VPGEQFKLRCSAWALVRVHRDVLEVDAVKDGQVRDPRDDSR